jgi:hypothetical protein
MAIIYSFCIENNFYNKEESAAMLIPLSRFM